MISPVSAPQRGQGPSSTRSGRSFSLSSDAICSTVARVSSSIPFMNASRSSLPPSLSPQPLLPLARELGGGQRMLLEHRDDLQALGRRLEVLRDALDVFASD